MQESNQISCGLCKDQGFIQRIKTYPLTPQQQERVQAIHEGNPKLAEYLTHVYTERDAGLERCLCTELRRASRWVDYCEAESGLSADTLARFTFDTWHPDFNPGCNAGYKVVHDLVKGADKRWVLLYGTHGLGKSHLLIAATGYLAKAGRNVRYVSATTLYERMLTASLDGTYGPEISSLKRQSVLILDDLGTEKATNFARELIHSLLDYRYQEALTTIVATNAVSLKEFPARLASRLTDARLVEAIRMDGDDVRPRL